MLSKIQNILIPSFLKRLDFWLLTHKPHIWRTRGHFVVFYCSIAAALLYIGGKMFPQNFADFQDFDSIQNTSIVQYFTYFLCFTSVGILMWWCYTIQKFGYRRTNPVHFLTEIGIYTLGLFTISMFVFAYERGFSYRQAYELEKNSREDSIWVVQNWYFQYGYMPHFQLNKELDLKTYFKDGELISRKIFARQNVVFDLLKKDEVTPNYNSDYPPPPPPPPSPSDFFSLSHWEYPSNEKKYVRPPQYKTPADYVNRILTNDTFWKQEEKRWRFKDDMNISREFLTNMTADEITNLIDEVYPKYFHKINYANETQVHARELLKLSINKKLFLESLSEQEIADYKTYLMWLKNNYSLYAPQPIIAFEKNAGQGFFQKRNNSGIYGKSEKDDFLNSIYVSCETYFDDDKGALAGEKLLHFSEKLDLKSFKAYFTYLQNENYNYGLNANKNNPQYVQNCKNYFSHYTPKTTLDSLYHYDYFMDKSVSEYTWMYIISDEYVQYVTSKYSDADYKRLRNLLHINSFEDVYLQSKNVIIQKLLQLHQVDDYTRAYGVMQQSRIVYESKKYLIFSFFALTYCLLLAIVFYIATLSNGIQFWISTFLAGFFGGFLMFLRQVFPRSYTSYPPLNYNYNNSPYFSSLSNWDNLIMYLFIFLIAVFMLIFIFRKTQLPKIQIWFNLVVFSSLYAVALSLDYWQQKVQIRMQNTNGIDDYYLSSDEKVRIYTLVLWATIAVYGYVAWLYKRHLTYPKQK